MTDIVLRPVPFVPTEAALDVAAAVLAGAGRKGACAILGRHRSTVAFHMKLLQVGLHVTSDAQVLYLLHDQIAARVKHP